MASANNLYIGNLAAHVDEAMLRHYFEPFGLIASLKVMRDPVTKASRGFGFVQYSDPMAAAGAVAEMNGAPVEGGNLLVKHADRNPNDNTGLRGPAGMAPNFAGAMGVPTAPPSDNVFVGGVPLEWTEADLNMAFSGCGQIVSSIMLKDKVTGRNKGAGLVRFADVASAGRAVQTLNGSLVEGTGRTLDVKFAERQEDKFMRKTAVAMNQLRFNPYGKPGAVGMPSNGGMMQMPHMAGPTPANMFGQSIRVPKRNDVQPEEGSNLHIFGLDPNVTELHLYEAFAGYGAIRSVRVMKDPATGVPKGFGFVQFFNVPDAQNAIQALNGLQVGSAAWSITVHNKQKGAAPTPAPLPRPGVMAGRST